MKVLYSEIKQFVPKLKASAKQVGDALTLIGLMADSLSEVKINGKKDWLLDLEVRQNRPDYLGILGIARDVAAYFRAPFVLPRLNIKYTFKSPLVKVEAAGDVKRVCVLKLEGLDNTQKSPKWMKETLEAYSINSVSLLVDISNLAMLLTGFPNHFFDADKVNGALVWQRVGKNQTFTTLDDTELNLIKNRELIIADKEGPLVLASAVGGQRSAVSKDTKNLLIEVAVYDPAKMRLDAKSLNVTTEASVRLEKMLSPVGARWALEFTAALVARHQGKAKASKIFDFNPGKSSKLTVIEFDYDLSSKIGGLAVGREESRQILARLGFGVKQLPNNAFAVTVPPWRMDVESSADLVEEVLRIKGFDRIAPRMPMLEYVKDVTPKRLTLEDRLKFGLAMLGFNETLTLPLTTAEQNIAFKSEKSFTSVRAQNAVNEELPELRQTLASGLVSQQHTYILNGIEKVSLFEAGKVFYKVGGRYYEECHLAILHYSPAAKRAVSEIQSVLNTLLRQAGAETINFKVLENSPDTAKAGQAFEIFVGKAAVGIIYKLRELPLSGNKNVRDTALAEMNLDALVDVLEKEKSKGPGELTGKLVGLDENLEMNSGNILSLQDRLNKLRTKAPSELWCVDVTDEFRLPGGRVRYTLRFLYQDLSDNQAKLLHEKLTRGL